MMKRAAGSVCAICIGAIIAGGGCRPVGNSAMGVSGCPAKRTLDREELLREFQEQLLTSIPGYPADRMERKELLDPEGEAQYAPRLIEFLVSEDQLERGTAAATLARLGEYARPVAPALVVGLKHTDEQVRYYCSEILAYVRADPSLALRALLEAAHDPSPRVRESALTAIYWTGPVDDESSGPLIAAVKEVIANDQFSVATQDSAGDEMLSLAKSVDRENVQPVLQRVAVRSEPTHWVAVNDRVRDPDLADSMERYKRVTAFYRAATMTVAAVPGVTAGLQSRYEVVREYAAQRLQELGARGASAARDLAEVVVGDDNPVVCRAAEGALYTMAGEARAQRQCCGRRTPTRTIVKRRCDCSPESRRSCRWPTRRLSSNCLPMTMRRGCRRRSPCVGHRRRYARRSCGRWLVGITWRVRVW